jgi:hypothetical protein
VFDEADPVATARGPRCTSCALPMAEFGVGPPAPAFALSGQWYRSFLRDELQHEPVVAREAVQVRMNLGQLLVDSGDLETAIQFFTRGV